MESESFTNYVGNYMQIARDYDLLVRVLSRSTETAAINFLSHEIPYFVICVLGPYVVDSTTAANPLSSHFQTQCSCFVITLTLVRKGSNADVGIKDIIFETVSASQDQNYRTCTLIQPQDEIGVFTFKSKMSNVDQQLFLATLDSYSYPNIKVFVKLISGSCLQDVQEHLAAYGLAPKLYGSAKVDGTPTAYIMECLDTSTWQTFLQSDAAALDPGQLRKALQDITATLESKKYIRGDLRTDNIMIWTNLPRQSSDLEVIDSDCHGL